MDKLFAALASMPEDSRLRFSLQQLMASAVTDARLGGPVGKALKEVAAAGANPADTAYNSMTPELATTIQGSLNALRGVVG